MQKLSQYIINDKEKVTHINKGKPFPLGSSLTSQGVNFSLVATNAEYVEILLFDKEDSISPKSVLKLDQTHNTGPYWHAEVKNLPRFSKEKKCQRGMNLRI